MWLPAFLVPAALAREPWARHLLARLGLSVTTATLVIATPSLVPELARWTDAACLLQGLVGLPCPGCGVTRSLLGLGAGDLSGAFRANPAGLAVAAALTGQAALATGLLLGRGSAAAGTGWLTWMDRMAIGALLAVWAARLGGLA